MDLTVLEQFGICRVLTYYLQNPNGVLRSDYRDKPLKLSSSTAQRTHKILFDNGLIKNIESATELRFVLTEKGKRIAEFLREIEKI